MTILLSLMKILIISVLWNRHKCQFIKSYLIEIHFHEFIQKSPIIFPKILTKIVYIRKLINFFRFHMNPEETFPLWITDSFCSVSIELSPQSETIYSMQVWTLSGKVLKCLQIQQESTKVCISVNVVLKETSNSSNVRPLDFEKKW